MSPFWILLELRLLEVVAIGAISRANTAKLQSKCRHQQTNTHFFTGQMPFLSPNQQCQRTEGKSNTTEEKNQKFSESHSENKLCRQSLSNYVKAENNA